MEEFLPAIHKSLISIGYKFILYHNMEHFALITPTFEKCTPDEGSYVIPIDDDQAFEMARGVDEFSFYVLTEFIR